MPGGYRQSFYSSAAADELMRSYMGAGAEIFVGEAPKYLQYLGTVAENIESPRPLQ